MSGHHAGIEAEGHALQIGGGDGVVVGSLLHSHAGGVHGNTLVGGVIGDNSGDTGTGDYGVGAVLSALKQAGGGGPVNGGAAESAAQAQNEKALKGARREQIQAAYEMWQKALAGLEIAEKSYTRVKNLHDQGVMSTQKLDEVTAQRNAARATEKAAKAQYDMAKNGAEREDKAAAAALVERAKGAVAEVESYIKETYLIAQTAGEVSEIFPKVGELVGTGAPIMNIAILDDMWITFNVREDLLQGLGMNTEFEAFIPALDKNIRLKVYYMKDLGTYAAWKATKTTGQFDLKTFEVKAAPQEKVEGLRPGMSVVLKK